jgi:hypothetical protein
MAAGSHMLNGKIADFDSAPARMSATAAATMPPAGGSATICEIR